MTVIIRPYEERDFQRVLAVCIAAFEPIHLGFEAEMGPAIFAREFPDWRGQYAKDIASLAAAGPDTQVHVAELDGEIAGFVTTTLHATKGMGEIGLNAVDPARQKRGVGRAMYEFALRSLKSRGAAYAYVGTGADAAHAPARAAYEAMGFGKVIPAHHYYREL